MSTPLITVIGSLNIDVIGSTARIPSAGETIRAQSDLGSGGKGANSAVSCARLSRRKDAVQDGHVRVKMVGAVGEDLFGPGLIDDLKRSGIDTEDVAIKKGEKTGVALVLVERNTGENRILISPNANDSLRPEDFMELKAPLPDLIVLQLEIPLEVVLQILEAASTHGVEVLLNNSPCQKLLAHAYKAVTHLVVNESEAAIMTGNEGKDVNWLEDCPERRALFGIGAKHITVTLGGKGGCYGAPSDGIGHAFEAKKVNVVDTTAAGDTFIGAYAVAVSIDRRRDATSMLNNIAWASEAAAITVQRAGAQAAIPWEDEVPPRPQLS